MSAIEELIEMAGNPDHLGYGRWEKTAAEAKAELTAWKKSVEGLEAQIKLLEQALGEGVGEDPRKGRPCPISNLIDFVRTEYTIPPAVIDAAEADLKAINEAFRFKPLSWREAERARDHWKGKCEVFEQLSLGCETPQQTVERIRSMNRLEPAKPRRLLTVCDCRATDLAHVHIEDLRIEVSR